MTTASDQSPPTVPGGFPNSSRTLEFAQALDCYIASYDRFWHEASAPGSLTARKGPPRQGMTRRLGGNIVAALTHLGSAMSAGGRGSAVGIM